MTTAHSPQKSWKKTTLVDIADFANGKSSPKRNERSPFRVYGSNGIIGLSDQVNAKENTIVIGRVGSYCGSLYYATQKSWITDNAIKATVKEAVSHPRFLWYLLHTLHLNTRATGSGQPLINQTTLGAIEVEIPELDEQKEIAGVLSSLDNKIELLQRQIETLEQITRAIFHEWFVEFNFPNKDGKPYKASGGKMVESELGEIPEGWRVGSMGEVVDIFDNLRIPLSSAERSKRKGQYPYYGATSVVDYVDDYLFDGEFLLLGEDGSVVDIDGFPILQYVYGRFWVNNHAHVLKGKSPYFTSMAYLLFKNTKVTDIVTGAVQLKINQNNLLKKKVVIAEDHIVEKIGNFFESCFAKRKENERQIAMLAKIRDTLLPRLMSGKIIINI